MNVSGPMQMIPGLATQADYGHSGPGAMQMPGTQNWRPLGEHQQAAMQQVPGAFQGPLGLEELREAERQGMAHAAQTGELPAVNDRGQYLDWLIQRLQPANMGPWPHGNQMPTLK